MLPTTFRLANCPLSAPVPSPSRRIDAFPHPFLVLPENRFAYTAIAELAEKPPRRSVRPIFIYGPAGVGKSHLVAIAVQNYLVAHPQAIVLHTTADRFAAEFAEASSEKRIAKFQAETRHADLLVFEDLQVLERRPETQRQLLSLADEVAANGGQLIWTCDKPAGELTDFLPKLLNRFRGGVTAAVRFPDRDSREGLLVHFASHRQSSLPAPSAQLIARELAVSPRELLAAVQQLDALARHSKRRLDSDLIRKFLDREVLPVSVSLADISRAVSRHFGLTPKELRAPSRSRRITLPRQCAMYLARELTGSPLAAVARHFGRRDHTTVLHACRRVTNRLPDDPILRRHLAQIRASLGTSAG